MNCYLPIDPESLFNDTTCSLDIHLEEVVQARAELEALLQLDQLDGPRVIEVQELVSLANILDFRKFWHILQD